jgi:hypothetical protein
VQNVAAGLQPAVQKVAAGLQPAVQNVAAGLQPAVQKVAAGLQPAEQGTGGAIVQVENLHPLSKTGTHFRKPAPTRKPLSRCPA